MSPRYDVPKAAPEPLRQVQLFVNTVDLERGDDWLADWLDERGVDSELERARGLREALRALLVANNGGVPAGADAVATLDAAAARLSIRVGADGPRVAGADAIDEMLALALGAMLGGDWRRLKACRSCRWAFYDYSRNRSATWCSMQICGNRTKTRAYRRRRGG